MQHLSFEIQDIEQLSPSMAQQLESLASMEGEFLVQVFSHSTVQNTLLQISNVIHQHIPNANIIGCSTNGEISRGKLLEKTTVISISQFETSEVASHLVSLNGTDELKTGEEFGVYVSERYPHAKGMIILANAIAVDCNDFMIGVQNGAGNIPIFGGGAGDYFAKEYTLVFNNTEFSSSGVAIAILSGDDLEIAVHSLQGWIPFGPRMEVTKADDNVIYEIDHKPAKQLYQHYIGKIEDEIFTDILSFPLMIERGDKSFARAPVYSEAEDSLAFLADVEQGDLVRFGYGDINVIFDEVNQSVEQLSNFSPDGLYLFSCGCRRIYLGEDIGTELQPFEALAPTAGFFTYGEYANLSSETNVLNTAFVVVAIKETLLDKESRYEKAEKAVKSEHGSKAMTRLMHFISQVTYELEEANAKLKDIAKLDGLTGIMNRGAFEEYFELEMRRCKERECDMAVVLMDIDHFKQVNDNFGHIIGDNMLKKIAHIINHRIRCNDIFARYGGEEFVLVLPETSLTEALDITEHLRKAVELRSGERSSKHVPNITASFGISIASHNQYIGQNVIKTADEALYAAKHAGRNRVEWR
ncbi:sensor domain-containing diguanylate cyclase [Alteromonas sp. a30]|uniref:sensor domain-containing diguanylate cyclase n=1 Tax=Alteromonas sp. a30 TaxID=2730917 RepID=UPI00227FF5B8|nr:diguanylate cyclase [Alteromonas sp. a30]MCY7295593.1 diguanylate cyclase [Alteromonas sp. a30]